MAYDWATELNRRRARAEEEEPAPVVRTVSAPAPIISPTPTQTASISAPPASANIPIVRMGSPETQYAQALIPFLSPVDSSTFIRAYGAPANTSIAPLRSRSYYQGSQTATEALQALERARTEAGAPSDDRGYQFLIQSIDLLQRYGVTDPTSQQGMSRGNYRQFAAEFNSLLEKARQHSLPSFYVNAATSFLQPTMVGSRLMPQYQVGGRTVFGEPSRQLY